MAAPSDDIQRTTKADPSAVHRVGLYRRSVTPVDFDGLGCAVKRGLEGIRNVRIAKHGDLGLGQEPSGFE
jgi:hypothetical protein